MLPPETLAKRQATVIGERIVAFTKGEDMLPNLRRFFPRDTGSLGVCKDLAVEVADVATLVWSL